MYKFLAQYLFNFKFGIKQLASKIPLGVELSRISSESLSTFQH